MSKRNNLEIRKQKTKTLQVPQKLYKVLVSINTLSETDHFFFQDRN